MQYLRYTLRFFFCAIWCRSANCTRYKQTSCISQRERGIYLWVLVIQYFTFNLLCRIVCYLHSFPFFTQCVLHFHQMYSIDILQQTFKNALCWLQNTLNILIGGISMETNEREREIEYSTEEKGLKSCRNILCTWLKSIRCRNNMKWKCSNRIYCTGLANAHLFVHEIKTFAIHSLLRMEVSTCMWQ